MNPTHLYPTNAVILALGNNPQKFLNQAFIICSHFEGISGREFIKTKDCLGTIQEQFADAYNFIASSLHKTVMYEGPKRVEDLEIPHEAIREVLINALVHRNYHIQAPIKIAIYDNRVEIFSPGNFPGPISTHNLCAGITYVRNIALAKILRHAGLIETLGTGFQTLFTSYAQRNLPEPEVIEGENYIKCILPREQLKKTRSSQAHIESDLQQILHLFDTHAAISIQDILKTTHLSRTTIGRKLLQLQKKGYIEAIGQGKGTHYIKKD